MMRWLRDPETVLTVICGLCLAAGLFGAPYMVYFVGIAAGSWFAIGEMIESLRDREFDVNLLMVMAAVGAIIVGHADDAAALLFLFSLSHTLESMALAKTKRAIESLIRLRPEKAIRVREGTDTEVGVAELRVGDVVRVLPYQNIPTDGTLAVASAQINEASITGESRPIDKAEGDPLYAGTTNLESMMLMTVSAAVGDNTLDKIMNLVSEAQENKASGERISQWFGQRYTIFVVAAFVLSLIIRMALAHETWGAALYGSLILLVALSPCALVISTPATTLSALAYAGRRGILVRGGQFIEEAGRIDTVALDKTGTLTTGRPQLVEVCVGPPIESTVAVGACAHGSDRRACAVCDGILCWHGGESMGEETAHIVRLAAAAEAYSTHPIAEAICAGARAAGIIAPAADEHIATPGYGIEAKIGDIHVKIGQTRFFDHDMETMPDSFRQHVREMQERGLTSVMLRTNGQWAALGLTDEVRASARDFVDQMRRLHVRDIVMLTGDHRQTAEAVGAALGIDHVEPGLLPEDKERLIGEWTSQGRQVLMVGDGVNDAPALTRANVGVAMGGLGSDIAMEAADVVLVQDRIERLPELMRLGRLTNRVIRANLLFAGGVIVTLSVLSMTWHLIPFLVHITPQMPLPMAVIGHEGSTVIVILNGLRLLRGPGA